MKVKSESEVARSCPTLCDPVDCSLPGFSVHGILQARILEWVTISSSRGSSRPRDRTQVSHIGGRRFNLWATREAKLTLYQGLSHTSPTWKIKLPSHKIHTGIYTIQYTTMKMRYYLYFIEEKTEDRKLGIFSRIMQFLMKKWDLSTCSSDFPSSICS